MTHPGMLYVTDPLGALCESARRFEIARKRILEEDWKSEPRERQMRDAKAMLFVCARRFAEFEMEVNSAVQA
jgi:hypothetical protein